MNRLTIFLLVALPLLFACTQKEQEVQEVRVESVTISQSSAEIEIGKTLQLSATVSPSTASRKDITVRILDHAGELIPDITRVLSIGI